MAIGESYSAIIVQLSTESAEDPKYFTPSLVIWKDR